MTWDTVSDFQNVHTEGGVIRLACLLGDDGGWGNAPPKNQRSLTLM